MKAFKPDAVRARTSTTVQVVNNQLGEVISSITKVWPTAAGLLALAQASIGYYLIYRQEELNQFTAFLRDNPDAFTEDIIASKEFQDGFIISLENYFKLRTEEKRLFAQKIFLGFGRSPEKQDFPLERFHDSLQKISASGLYFLAFIQNTIIPYRDKEIQEEVDATHSFTEAGGQTREWWIEDYTKNRPISKYLNKWLEEEYNFSSPACRKKFKLPNTIGEEELENLNRLKDQKREDISYSLSELDQLGIVRGNTTEAGWGASGYEQRFTEYGKQFIDFIPSTESEDL
jgi:hypothetical protein